MRELGREEEELEDTVSHLSIYLTSLDQLYREQAAQLKHQSAGQKRQSKRWNYNGVKQYKPKVP